MELGETDEHGLYGFENRIEIIDIDGLVDLGVLVKPDFIRIDERNIWFRNSPALVMTSGARPCCLWKT